MTGLEKILIVDDDSRNIDIFKHLLENQYQLATASNGEEALQKVKTFDPDLVLLDIMMPGINGYDVCKIIKDGGDKLIKVILVSAKAMLDERLQGYEAGADDYIAKPFDHDEFLAKVKIFLRLKKTEDQLLAVNSSLEGKINIRTRQLTEAERQASIAKSYLDNVIESMIDPLFVLSLDSRIQRVNRATTDLTGYSPEELFGNSLSSYVKEDGSFTGPDYERLIKRGFLGNKSLTLISKNGLEIPTLLSRSVIRDENGHVSGIVCVAKDVTEQRKVEKEKEGMYRQLIQASKLASIGELAAGIAHEINNPLTIIQGNTEIFHDYFSKNTEKDYLKYARYQQDALDRIINIVNGLRTYARIDTIELTHIDLHKILQQSIEIVHQIYKNENIKIKIEFTATESFFSGSDGRFQQVIMNLISNAKDALTQEKKAGTITLWTGNIDGHVILKVSDDGCGIPEEHLGHIFEPFYTSKPAGEGTGLGLSIVLSIVHEMGGDIKVDSTVNTGTTFTLSFPCVSQELPKKNQDADSEKQALHPASVPAEEVAMRFDGRVLVADDEEVILELMTLYLKECGFDVDHASDGREALEKLNSGSYRLLITDLKMPRMRGEELIQHIRNERSFAPLKIMAITGNLSSIHLEEETEKIKKDVDRFLKKPFSKKEFYSALKGIL